jgi:hypothetical protein
MTARLTDTERQAIARAREITGVRLRDVRAWAGDEELSTAAWVAFTRAQQEIRELLAIAERLGGAGDQAVPDDTVDLPRVRDDEQPYQGWLP